jgi:hypothetical protein
MVFVLAESASQNPDLEDSAILRSQKAKAHEAWIQLIRCFLETQECPNAMLDKEYQSFINSATVTVLGPYWDHSFPDFLFLHSSSPLSSLR